MAVDSSVEGRHGYFLSSLDVIETLKRIQPMAFGGKSLPTGLTPDNVKSLLAGIDLDDPALIHPLREIIRRTIDPNVGEFAPGWSVQGPTTDEAGFVNLAVEFGTPEFGAPELSSRSRKLHARPADRIYQTYVDMFAMRCSLEVNNGLSSSHWNEANISEIISAANTGNINTINLRAKDKPAGRGSSLELFDGYIIPLVKKESWEDLMQTHGIIIRSTPDIFENAELFTSVGSGTGIKTYATLVYSDSPEVPPPAFTKISKERLEEEIDKLRSARHDVLGAHTFRGSDTQAGAEAKRMFRNLLVEVASDAEEFMRRGLPLDPGELLSGAEPSHPHPETAVYETVEDKLRPIQVSGGQDLVKLYTTVRDELLAELRGVDRTSIWLGLTKGRENEAPFVLITPKAINASQIPILLRAGFVGAATPDTAGGVSGHLLTMARSDLFPVLTELYGVGRADGYDILGYVKHYRNPKCLLVDNHPSEGGSNLVLSPDPRVVENFGLAGKERTKMPFPKYSSMPNNRTRDGVEINVHAVMDNLMEDRVKIVAGLGFDGVGLARLESSLRFIGEGWEFIPGDKKSRNKFISYIIRDLKPAVATFEENSLPEFRKSRFSIRLTDIRPSEPNKMPTVLRRFYVPDSPESIEFLLANADDLLVPQARAIFSVQRATQHPMSLIMPYIESNEQIIAVRGNVPEGVDLEAMIESRRGVEKMPSMQGVKRFKLGVNDLAVDVLGVTRGVAGYDQLNPKVLREIKRGKGNADRMGIDVDVCSNIAEDPPGIVALIGLGIRSLTVPVVSAELVRRAINRVESARAREEVEKILSDSETREVSGEEVRRRLNALLSR